MKNYKLNWRYWFFLILFLIILILGIRVVYLALTGQIVDENGEKLGFLWAVIPVAVITPILLLYLISFINMLKLFVRNKGCGLKMSDEGIENTAVVLKLLAIILVLPVKHIPWRAVKYYNTANDAPSIRVDIKEVQAGFFAKIILKIFGYNFCKGFVKPDVLTEDVDCHAYRFSINTK